MHNPLRSTFDDSNDPVEEAAEYFGPLSGESLPEATATTIRSGMLAALRNSARPAPAARFTFAGAAIVAPLLAVGVVGAAAGESPISGTLDAIESAASTLGIGGDSGETRQDLEVRNEAAEDFGQPGSQPGNTANAPGLVQGAVSAETPEATPEATPGAAPADAPVAAVPEDAPSDEATDPHANGKGCDDVLFGQGEPPFASPGGPVGCEVGNSADHRKNGAKNDDGETDDDEDAGDDDGATGDDPADEAEDEDDKPGGTSRGLGNGHDEDRPGNGQANGHDKHDHDPNPNGNGPDKGDGGDDSGDATSEGEEDSGGPGKSAEKKPDNPGGGKKN